jgi:hypothetical protein
MEVIVPNDITGVEKPIEVSSNQGGLDALAALGRQLVLILGGGSILLTLAGERNLQGMIDFLQSADGAKWVAALVTVGTLVWGQWKTWRRGKQLATAGADRRVPDAVIKVK